MAVTLSLKEMLKNGVHYGHKASRWNPKMKKYIYGKRSGLHLLDLEKSAEKFAEALEFIHEQISNGKVMLMVGTKLQTASVVQNYADASQTPYIINRWLGGTLTNFKTIQGRIRHYKKLEAELEGGELEKYTKKERVEFQKELVKLDKAFSGVRDIVRAPDFLFVTDINSDRIAVTEAKKMGIPVVGFADTNTDPTLLDYPIPANDDAVNSLKYLLGVVNEVVVDARNNAKANKLKAAAEAEKKKAIDKKVISEKEAGAKAKPKAKVIPLKK